MVKMMFEMYERLPSDYKDALRAMRDSHAADLVELRSLLESKRWVPSLYWPTRAHVETEILMLDAFLAGCHEELQSEYRGDLSWWRAQAHLREAEAYAAAKRELPIPCLARLGISRPRTRRCAHDDQWAAPGNCCRLATRKRDR